MDAAEFLDAVARRAAVPPLEAPSLVRATLTTLAERVGGDEARDLAGRLPEELRGHLHKGVDFAEPLDLVEFRNEVGARLGVDDQRAGEYARAVLTTLREAVGSDGLVGLEAELPRDLRRLLHPA